MTSCNLSDWDIRRSQQLRILPEIYARKKKRLRVFSDIYHGSIVQERHTTSAKRLGGFCSCRLFPQ